MTTLSNGLDQLRSLSPARQVTAEHGVRDMDRHSFTDRATGGRSTSASQQCERLPPADALRELPLGHGLLVYGRLPPARVRSPLLQ